MIARRIVAFAATALVIAAGQPTVAQAGSRSSACRAARIVVVLEPLTSTGTGTEAQSVDLSPPACTSAWLLGAGNEMVVSVTVDGQGTYTIDPREEYTLTFIPVPGYAGTADPVTYRLRYAADDSEATGTYTPTVTAPAPPEPEDLVSTGVGTRRQTATVDIPPGGSVELGDLTADAVYAPGKGDYDLDTDTGVISFTALFGYAGVVPAVTYAVTDAYDQTATATYTPTVLAPAGPDPAARRSRGGVNDSQQVRITVPTGGEITLVDAAGDAVDTVTFAGEGRYALDPDTGVITFATIGGFTGSPSAVTFRVTDAYGQSADATYAAYVTGDGGTLPITG